MQAFQPLRRIDGYLPIERYGLIGDGATAALVGADGAIAWLCVPRFDSPPLFCGILDRERGGAFTVAPDETVESCQEYAGETGVLVTQIRSPSGLVQVTDVLALVEGSDLSPDAPAARQAVVRAVEVLEGEVRLQVRVEPHGGAQAERRGDGLRVRCNARPDLDLQLYSTRSLEGLRTTYDLSVGDRLHLVLHWGAGSHRRQIADPEALIRQTGDAWQRWVRHISYDGPREGLVRRSAITLKMLHHIEHGPMVAAPTSSLPEVIGGHRNWDYRYVWIRDAAMGVYALRRIGLSGEPWAFLSWVLDATEKERRPRVLYTIDGIRPPPERLDTQLSGYRASAPVRWSNAASDQVQHDVYGEILDSAYQWATYGGRIDEHIWARLREVVEMADRQWRKPDKGIWEVRTSGRRFTYSTALCQVALDRGARLAKRFGLEGAATRWERQAERIRETILEQAWDADAQTLTESLEGRGVDASLLALPLRRVIPADHPKMVATTRAVRERLDAGKGLLYRYIPEESPDGLGGREGAFLLCSFWLVDNLALQGHLDEAMQIFDSLCDRANPLGLLPEEVDPESGCFLGNFPQGFSHIGLVESGMNLGRALRGKQPEPGTKESR